MRIEQTTMNIKLWDAIIFEHKSEKDFILVIDGMIKTLEFYKKNLKKYKMKGGFLVELNTYQNKNNSSCSSYVIIDIKPDTGGGIGIFCLN